MKNNKTILVIGASGLVGSSAIYLLYRLGYEVIALYRNNNINVTKWPSIIIDLLQMDLNKVVNKYSINTILHCAAIIPKSFSNTDDAYSVNKRIDDNVLNCVSKTGAKIIYASSTSLYEKTSSTIKETTKINLDNTYSKGKYETEQAISLLSKQNIALRINAPYGPEQRMNTVLKIFIENALQNTPITYHGTGQREQDFTASEDIANAMVKCIEDDDASGIFNISGGNPISMKDLAKKIVALTPNCQSQIGSSGLLDVQEGYRANFSIEKANCILGWKPQITLDDGIQKWINYLSNENRATL